MIAVAVWLFMLVVCLWDAVDTWPASEEQT